MKHTIEDSGKANWIWADIEGPGAGCHIPCCRSCGAGPMDSDEIIEGFCTECVAAGKRAEANRW